MLQPKKITKKLQEKILKIVLKSNIATKKILKNSYKKQTKTGLKYTTDVKKLSFSSFVYLTNFKAKRKKKNIRIHCAMQHSTIAVA